MHIDELLRIMGERDASDLHLRVGALPIFRINGQLKPYGEERITVDWIRTTVERVLTDKQQQVLHEQLAVDSSYAIESWTRFRLNAFYQRGTLSLAFRNIFTDIPTLASLGLPTVLASFCERPQGLVIVCGPTGSGKSSTLAAMLQHINTTRAVHIVTVEDPVEFLFRDDQAFMTQREVGVDTPDYRTALKNALRQDPDVILIGEIRDRETMETALSAAETGHLVLTTVHANSAPESVSRIVDSFAPEERPLVRKQLADVLVATLYQRLLQTTEGTQRVPALEIMINSPRIRDLVRENQLELITEEMERSVTVHRMQSFEQSLIALLANRRITYAEAVHYSMRPPEMKLMMDKLGIAESGEILSRGVIRDEGILR